MPDAPLASIDRVADVLHVRGADAPAGAPPGLLVEVPHGATRAAHFESLRAELRGEFPEGLRDFFFVNTDVGAPEVAEALAGRIVRAAPTRSVAVIRCRIPRTFVDCNRVIAPDARPAASPAGGVTPGIASYVRDDGDLRLLLARYAAYRDLVTRAVDLVCGAGGTALMLHSYAPRSIDVPVDERIVERLRAEYAPGRIETWPLRAEVDLITRDPDGRRLADAGLVASVRSSLERAGYGTAEGEAYALHPSTLAWTFAARWPGQTLCIEMRRDLLARTFTPFAEMEIDPAKAGRMADALAAAFEARPSG
jgi:hypothetical protein